MNYKKSLINVFGILPLITVMQSCMTPGLTNSNGCYSGGMPASTTETHTKTTMVMPPSYATVNMPAPTIMQSAPSIQQPMMYQSPQTNQCMPMQSSYDPCAYQVQMPQASAQRYTIAIPPAPAPSYTIALPQGNPPQYAVVQQQAPIMSQQPVMLKSDDNCTRE